MTMSGQAQTEAAAAEEPAKVWRPSGRPAHRADQPADEARVVEQHAEYGVLGRMRLFLKRSFVRLVIGLGIFILAAIVYDETVNFGDWTERKERATATKHRGLAPIEQTPDG